MNSHTEQALTVSAVAKFIYSIIAENISSLWIRGEISNFKIQQNGNAYFNIKDSEAKLNAIIMANSNAQKHISELKNGLEILVYGRISYYKKEGYITLFTEEIEFVGEGLLKQKFDELKKKLESEGLFNKEHKRKIPEFPQCVGIVTSPSGAAIQDILNVTSRRFSSVNIILFPASVQGESAVQDIVSSIKVANKYAYKYIDVLIVGRGGGSLEDLWCFNEEAVARAIYGSKIPVISAVGHEIDYTIADYVADMRAPTPSAAAELVVKDKKEILKFIESIKDRIDVLFINKYDSIRNFLEIRGQGAIKRLFQEQLSDLSLTLENLSIRFTNNFKTYLNQTRSFLNLHKEKLNALHPHNTLKRGYTITYKIDSQGRKSVVSSINDIHQGNCINTLLHDGDFNSKVQ